MLWLVVEFGLLAEYQSKDDQSPLEMRNWAKDSFKISFPFLISILFISFAFHPNLSLHAV